MICEPEALIVGGGPAGTAAGIMLARSGVEAVLIERQVAAHDSVCGGFLGWDGVSALGRLGIDIAALGAPAITQLRLVNGHRVVERALPHAAVGLSRRRLDEAMLAAASAAGVEVRRGVTARSAEAATIRTGDGTEWRPGATILATGKYELRGAARTLSGARDDRAVGLRTAFAPSSRLAKELAGVVELHPFDGGYAGLLLQEDGCVNLCLSAAGRRLREAGSVPALLARIGGEAPRLGERLACAGAASWVSVSNVPYGWRAGDGAPRLFRVGDQASVIASLAGDGIAIALTSGIAAAAAVARGDASSDYQRRWSRQAARPLRVAEGLRWAAERALPRRAMIAAAAVPGLAGMAARMTRIA